MSAWQKLLEHPHSREHFVQLYQADDTALIRNVGLYLAEGLKRGAGGLVIATPEHRKLFLKELDRLGIDSEKLIENHQFLILDADETLALFMVGGQPDWHLFEAAVSKAMKQVVPADHNAGLRAYGEMVGILWKARQFAAAIRLEQLWNKRLEQSSFSLYCAYAIDIFGKDFQAANLEGILCTHTHLVPAQPDGKLETALNRAMDEILGDKSDALRVSINAQHSGPWAVMPNAEAVILWLRKNLPLQADDIVSRAHAHFLRSQLADPALAS